MTRKHSPSPLPPSIPDYVTHGPIMLPPARLRQVPPPGPPAYICRSPGPCCEHSTRPRRCEFLTWIVFAILVLMMLGVLALTVIDWQTVGYGLD